jgi:hypothetical protein
MTQLTLPVRPAPRTRGAMLDSRAALTAADQAGARAPVSAVDPGSVGDSPGNDRVDRSVDACLAVGSSRAVAPGERELG